MRTILNEPEKKNVFICFLKFVIMIDIYHNLLISFHQFSSCNSYSFEILDLLENKTFRLDSEDMLKCIIMI